MHEYVPYVVDVMRRVGGPLLARADAAGAPRRLVLVGHSMGGSVALMTVAAFPELAWRLVLIDSLGPLIAQESELPTLLRKSVEFDAALVRRSVFATWQDAAERGRAMWRSTSVCAARVRSCAHRTALAQTSTTSSARA